MNFNKDERVQIWNDIKSFCNDESQHECEDKLQELFKFGNFDMYFERLSDLHYTLEPYTNSDNDFYLKDIDTQKVVFTLLDAFIAYEYFNKHIKDKGHYDHTRLRKKFEEIKPFLVSESKIEIKVPIHPNYTYNDALHTLIEHCGIGHELAHTLLNPLFDVEKKPPQTMQAKREAKAIFDIFTKILDGAEEQGHNKKEIEEVKTEIMRLKKYL